MRKISSIIIVFLVITSVGTVFGTNGLEPSGSELDEFMATTEGRPFDVPTWRIGTSWTYFQEYWSNDTDPDAILQEIYIEETLTYTVSSVEFKEVEGVSTPVYNVTLEGEVFDGEGIAETALGTLDFSVDSGVSGGYFLYRMDDLSLLVDHQHKAMDMSLRDYDLDMDTYTELTETHEPGLESFDFPLSPSRHFWANNTVYTDGYSNVKVGPFDETRPHEKIEDLTRKIQVSEDMVSLEVPAGTFDNTYKVTEEISDDDEGYRIRHYCEDVQMYVREVQNLEIIDWRRELVEYHIPDNPNSLSVDPFGAYVGQTVTVNGSFPNNPSEDFRVSILMGGVEQIVQTDGDGFFTLDIEVPNTPDNTPTFGLIGSHGVIAQSTSDPSDTYQTATLCVLHPEGLYPPSSPRPIDGGENVPLNPTLEVYVEHAAGLDMDVTFYDASDHSVIGVDQNVESGSVASVNWSGRAVETVYSWYAEVDDGIPNPERSATWTFTTGHGGDYYELHIDVEGEGTFYPISGGFYEQGEEVAIIAEPAEGWYFVEWIGDTATIQDVNSAETYITMNGDYTITARFGRGAYFEVQILSPRSNERFDEGDEIIVNYTITNTGDSEGTRNISFLVDGEEIDVHTVTLDGGEEYSRTFTWIGEKSGKYELEVTSEDTNELVVIRVDQVPSWLQRGILWFGIFLVANCLLSIILFLALIAVVAYVLMRRRKKRSRAKEMALEKEKIILSIHNNRKVVEDQFSTLQDKFEEADNLGIDVSEEKRMFVDIKLRYHRMKLDEEKSASLKKAKSDLIFIRSFLDELVSTVSLKLDEELDSVMDEDIQEINQLIMTLEDNIQKAREQGLDVTELEDELEEVKSGIQEALEGEKEEMEMDAEEEETEEETAEEETAEEETAEEEETEEEETEEEETEEETAEEEETEERPPKRRMLKKRKPENN
ncbi:MAG: hypothetical protein R6U17_03505 [Thermoplasmata archaeon]